jgi:ribosomal protein S6--L-glutamate ligase
MDIALLTRGPGLYSSQRLYRACLDRGHHTRLLDYSRCSLVLGEARPQIYYLDQPLEVPQGIIPRIGATLTSEGAALIRHFEGMKVATTTPSRALVQARDKLHSLQILARRGVAVPVTVFAEPEADLSLVAGQVGGFPCIVKPLESTHGIGIRLVHSLDELWQVLRGVFSLGQPVLVQEFIAEAKGEDVRVFIVDGEVVGAMKRVAKMGDFRSNLHQGGMAFHVRLTDIGEALAIAAARVLGLGVAGVDILESNRGPLVLEINASPGLEGIEKVTGQDIAGRIVAYLEKRIEEKDEEE